MGDSTSISAKGGVPHPADAAADCTGFLSQTLSAGDARLERRETHISHVFLTQDRAYKLKKPVKLAFLDFSSLAQREAACRRELAVNRAFAPNLYLGLRPILAARDGALRIGPLLTDPDAPVPYAFGGDGGEKLLDWVVEMRRFDKDGEFDRLAEAGALTPQMMRALADRVSEIHRAAPAPDPSALGPSALATIAQVLASLCTTPAAPAAAAWAERAAAEAARISCALESRRRHGYPRRLHGDLHLGNICLLDGVPTPFDAIEFDDAIATIDPLYDVAFTAMDLIWRKQPELAQVFISRYLSATRDYRGMTAWPLFLSLRAAIRGMTAMLSGDKDKALDKLHFALALLEPRPKPALVVLAGLSGSGKSTMAQALAPKLGPLGGALTISSDETRKRLFGVAPEARLGPEGYEYEASQKVYRRMRVDAQRALKAGATVVLDGVFGRRAERDEARALAEKLGADFHGFWLETPRTERLERVDRRASGDIPDSSDADRAVAAAQCGDFHPAEKGWARLDAGGETSNAAKEALRRFGSSRKTDND